jgi:hypothetical protein
MKFCIRLRLEPNDTQKARLQDLQRVFAQVCNALAPTVQSTRVWNRVALHHMAYKVLREAYPALGSQMVCNAIYAVSKSARLVFQTPKSPFYIDKYKDKPLPLLRFLPSCPVYFDKHTLSLRAGLLSMYTLDGRLKFELALSSAQAAAFMQRRLLEIVLQQVADGGFEMKFWLGEPLDCELPADQWLKEDETQELLSAIPAYVAVEAAE